MRALAFVFPLLISGMAATPAGAFVRLAAANHVVEADWQPPRSLPRRFRNHCAVDPDRGRAYCSDHCGFDYQFYFCSHASYGCCRVGYGYCDWTGLLRCAP